MTTREVEGFSQALMLVKSSLVSHGELIGIDQDGVAFYAHNDGSTKTAIARPSGPRPEGVRPLGHSILRSR